MEKFTADAVAEICGHNLRTHRTYANPDIHPEKTHRNFSFPMSHEGMTDFKYYQKRVGEVYLYGRGSKREKKMITAVSWVVTAPAEITGNTEKEKLFFSAVYAFVSERYGKENIISNAVHYDESGRPHIHIFFIPVTKLDHDRIHFRSVRTSDIIRMPSGRYEYGFRFRLDPSGEKIPVKNYAKLSDYYEEKISANDVINKIELQKFHTDLQQYLIRNHVEGVVKNGATGGMNIPVKDLKSFTKETGLTMNDIQGLDNTKSLLTNYLNRFSELNQKLAEKDAIIQQLQEKIQSEKEKTESVKTQKNRQTGWGTSKEWGTASDIWNNKEEEKSW